MEGAIAISVAVLLAQRAAEQVEGAAGAGAWTGIDQLRETVRRRFGSDIVAARILDEFEAKPDDEVRIVLSQNSSRSRGRTTRCGGRCVR